MPQVIIKVLDPDRRPYIRKILKDRQISCSTRSTARKGHKRYFLNDLTEDQVKEIFPKQIIKKQLTIGKVTTLVDW